MLHRSPSPRRAGGAPAAHVSVVLVSRDDDATLRRTVDQLLAATPSAELVVVDDRSDDRSDDGGASFLAGDYYRGVRLLRHCHPLGMAAKWNAGAAGADGEVLVFAGSQLIVDRGWAAALAAELAPPEVGAAGPALVPLAHPGIRIAGLTWTDAALDVRRLRCHGSDPQPVPLLTGHCLALRREVFAALGGFDVGMLRRGGAAVELCLRLWRCGYQCRVAPGSVVTLQPTATPPGRPVDQADLHDRLRLGIVHLAEARLQQLVRAVQPRQAFAAAMARVVDGDVGQRRATVQARAVHDDAWFLDRFAIAAFASARGWQRGEGRP